MSMWTKGLQSYYAKSIKRLTFSIFLCGCKLSGPRRAQIFPHCPLQRYIFFEIVQLGSGPFCTILPKRDYEPLFWI